MVPVDPVRAWYLFLVHAFVAIVADPETRTRTNISIYTYPALPLSHVECYATFSHSSRRPLNQRSDRHEPAISEMSVADANMSQRNACLELSNNHLQSRS